MTMCFLLARVTRYPTLADTLANECLRSLELPMSGKKDVKRQQRLVALRIDNENRCGISQCTPVHVVAGVLTAVEPARGTSFHPICS